MMFSLPLPIYIKVTSDPWGNMENWVRRNRCQKMLGKIQLLLTWNKKSSSIFLLIMKTLMLNKMNQGLLSTFLVRVLDIMYLNQTQHESGPLS